MCHSFPVTSILPGQTPMEKSKRKGLVGAMIGLMGKVVPLMAIRKSQTETCPLLAVIPSLSSQDLTSIHVLHVLCGFISSRNFNQSKHMMYGWLLHSAFQGSFTLHLWVTIFILFLWFNNLALCGLTTFPSLLLNELEGRQLYALTSSTNNNGVQIWKCLLSPLCFPKPMVKLPDVAAMRDTGRALGRAHSHCSL